MNLFRNILCVSCGLGDESEAFRQALTLARDNGANLKVLVVAPALPETFGDYRTAYEESLAAKARENLDAARAALGLAADVPPVGVELECGETPAVRIIRHVLRSEHDLVIKTGERTGSDKGFLAVDMDLLRKCPCAVWLCRPSGANAIAVAVDPVTEELSGRDLGIRLLSLSHSLAESRRVDLKVISCWYYKFEDYLRGYASPAVIAAAAATEEREHRARLDALIEAAIGAQTEVHHIRGNPVEKIPMIVDRERIGLLVMGTVGRTGIAGVVFGNTAENIIRKLDCSLLALKPPGFVSPVNAY